MMSKSEVVLTTQRENITENASSTWLAINMNGILFMVYFLYTVMYVVTTNPIPPSTSYEHLSLDILERHESSVGSVTPVPWNLEVWLEVHNLQGDEYKPGNGRRWKLYYPLSSPSLGNDIHMFMHL